MKVKLERGDLARHTGHDSVGVVISLDPPTACCEYEPCNHSLEKYYTPMARMLWQTGDDAGKEGVVLACWLQAIENNTQTTENKK
jgi:hypothetical protein